MHFQTWNDHLLLCRPLIMMHMKRLSRARCAYMICKRLFSGHLSEPRTPSIPAKLILRIADSLDKWLCLPFIRKMKNERFMMSGTHIDLIIYRHHTYSVCYPICTRLRYNKLFKMRTWKIWEFSESRKKERSQTVMIVDKWMSI